MGSKKTIAVLISMAFSGALGLLLLFLACALPVFEHAWWAMFVIIFYLMAPFPLGIVRCLINREFLEEGGNCSKGYMFPCMYVGLPLVLAHSGVIPILSGVIACIGNLFMFGTVYSYFIFFRSDDEWEFSSF